LKELKRLRKRLEDLRAKGFRVIVGQNDFARFWPNFCDLHRNAWPSSPFHTDQGQHFFGDLISAKGFECNLELSVIEFEGRPVAMHFGFIDAWKVYHYMPVMDPEFRKDRVGAVLLYAMILHYAKTHEHFDFLRGMEAYKSWYTDELILNMRIVAYRSSSVAALAYNSFESTRRYAMELGFPKALAQNSKRSLNDLLRLRNRY
jgi:hypothetical protein